VTGSTVRRTFWRAWGVDGRRNPESRKELEGKELEEKELEGERARRKKMLLSLPEVWLGSSISLGIRIGYLDSLASI
jgi:hypothetical protein